MKWIKHDTDANQDAKLQNVLLDYGLEGYGLYWYCIELIAGKVDKDNITFDLEHDARIIARNTGSTPKRVEEIMRYFVQINLFEDSNGVVTCLKLARRLDKSMTSNPDMRAIIESLKNHDPIMTQSANNHDSVMTPSEKPMQDKIRLDQIRVDKNKDMCASEMHDECFESVWLEYPTKLNKKKAKSAFFAYCKRNKLDVKKFSGQLKADICKRCETQQFGFDKLHFTTYMSGERWDDTYATASDKNSTHDMIDSMDFSELNEGN